MEKPTKVKSNVFYASCLCVSLFTAESSMALSPIEDVLQINGTSGEYLEFYLSAGTNDACRSGPPAYGRVTGLPSGMYRGGGCSFYGYPEDAGTFRLEFPVVGGVWLADLIVASDDSTSVVSSDIFEINGVAGAYLEFHLSEGTSANCRMGAPDYSRVAGLPTGMFADGNCSLYGYPAMAGTSQLEFPVVGGQWLAELVITSERTDPIDPDPVDPDPVDPDPVDPGNVAECIHEGRGTDFPVGPGQIYSTMAAVPWGALGPGDSVRIFYKPTPYNEKIIVSTSGTEQNPITVCGVAGPNGERPVLDGDGATNSPADSNAYGTYAPMEGLAIVMLYNRDYNTKVHNIVIEGLHIRNAKDLFGYTRMNGSTDTFGRGAACIRIQAGDNIVIRSNELENCGNGIFTMSQAYNEASLTRNVLIEGNYLHGHGQTGSYLEHGMYIQAIGATYQYNRFGANATGSLGSTLKERVAGSVIRYNWFDSGSSRVLDIVEVQDAAPWYLEQSYREWASNNGETIDAERLEVVRAAETAYRNTYVYGNFINHVGSQTNVANMIHYGFDNTPALAHRGTMHFYNNTLSIINDRSDSWRIRLFDVSPYDENAGVPAEETIEVINNIIYFSSETTGASPSYFCLGRNSGTINFGVNWVSDNWSDVDTASNCYASGALLPIINGTENFVDNSGASMPIIVNTLAPNNIPTVREQAQGLPSSLRGHSVVNQYVRHLGRSSRSSANDLGAEQLLR